MNDETTNHLVHWNPETEDSGFTVIDSKKFEKQILPQYFKVSDISSFIRQLNMYQFHKQNKR